MTTTANPDTAPLLVPVFHCNHPDLHDRARAWSFPCDLPEVAPHPIVTVCETVQVDHCSALPRRVPESPNGTLADLQVVAVVTPDGHLAGIDAQQHRRDLAIEEVHDDAVMVIVVGKQGRGKTHLLRQISLDAANLPRGGMAVLTVQSTPREFMAQINRPPEPQAEVPRCLENISFDPLVWSRFRDDRFLVEVARALDGHDCIHRRFSIRLMPHSADCVPS